MTYMISFILLISDGVSTLLNTADTHSIINYVYQRYLKIKNWVPSRHYSFYMWIIYGWKELPHHSPSHDSNHGGTNLILSRWVLRSTSYEDFMSYDHYEIDQSQNQGENNTILPKLISSKKKLMMPKNHFQENY